jgi:hypothetical protein
MAKRDDIGGRLVRYVARASEPCKLSDGLRRKLALADRPTSSRNTWERRCREFDEDDPDPEQGLLWTKFVSTGLRRTGMKENQPFFRPSMILSGLIGN